MTDQISIHESKHIDEISRPVSSYTFDKRDSKFDSNVYCIKSSTLDGCGNCNYSLSNSVFMISLDTTSIVDVFHVLIEESSLLPCSKVLLSKSTITCTGDINLLYRDSIKSSNIVHNRIVCFRVIDEWLRTKVSEVHEAIKTVYLIICAAILYYGDDQQRACKILQSFEVLYRFIREYISSLSN